MTERRRHLTKILSLAGIGLVVSASAVWFTTSDRDNETPSSSAGRSAQRDRAVEGWRFEISGRDPSGLVERAPADPFASAAAATVVPPAPLPVESQSSRDTDHEAFVLRVSGGLIDVQAADHRLADLLAGISDQSGVRIAYDGVIAGETVTARFEGLPLDEGLRRLLEGWDSFFLYASDGTMRAAWVVERETGEYMEPVDPSTMVATATEDSAAPAEVHEDTASAGPGEVLQDLNDTDPAVRSSALFSAYEIGAIPDADTLSGLARSEPDAKTRGFALAMLGDSAGPDSIEYRSLVAEMASRDKDPGLREEARDILDELERRDREGEPVQGEE